MKFLSNTDIKDLRFTNYKLGNGSYASVQLVYHIKNRHEFYAYKKFKIANYKVFDNEFKIMKCLRGHPNIINLLGICHLTLDDIGMILEYANGGDLLKKITPNIGIPVLEAWNLFTNLINAINYMHTKGIAHRDIKPENLLISYFIVNGITQRFTDTVGSPAYMPLEVYYPPYKGEPSDIWQCGLVLFAMLTGKLPWKKACTSDPDFAKYVMGRIFKLDISTSNISFDALSLISEMLCIIPEKRATFKDIVEHRFIKKYPKNNNTSNYNIFKKVSHNGNVKFVSLTEPVKFSLTKSIPENHNAVI